MSENMGADRIIVALFLGMNLLTYVPHCAYSDIRRLMYVHSVMQALSPRSYTLYTASSPVREEYSGEDAVLRRILVARTQVESSKSWKTVGRQLLT